MAGPVAVTLALYLPAIFGTGWVADDWQLIPRHLRPGDIAGEWTTPTHEHAADLMGGYMWRPLTATVYQVVGEAFGRTPEVFRGLSLAVHLVNVLLVGALARRLGAGPRGAALLTLAWAVHPLLPDAVCWIADLCDVLAATLLLLGAWVAVGAPDGRATAGAPARVAAGAALFLLALLAKEASLAWAAVLPLALLARRGWREAAAHAAALAVVAVGHGRWHSAVVGSFETGVVDIVRRAPGHFAGVWSDYLRWPLHLPVRAGFTHLVEPGNVPVSALGVASVVGAAAAWGLGTLRGRAAWAAVGTAGLVWVVMVSPGAMAAVTFGQQSSRYLYLPLTLAVPWIGGALAAVPSERAGRLLAAAAGAWCLAWLPVTVPRVGAWRSEATLYPAELRAEPDNPIALKEVGRLLYDRGQPEQGLALWAQALANPPASSFVMDVQAERLAYAQRAWKIGRADLALVQLDAFLAHEAAAGRPVHPSVTALREEVAAGVGR